MTISLVPEDTRVRRFTCGGGETVFAVTFPVFAATDVQVLRVRAGVTVTLTNPGDYTLSGVGHPSGFTVTLTAAAQAGDLIVVVSAQPVARTAEWTDGQALRAQALNAEFARWWIALQQVQRDVTRTVRLPLTDPSAGLELPDATVRAGKFLGFDGTGAVVAMGAPDAPLGAVARSGDTMLGPLTLSGAPTAPLHAATKAYVDAADAALNTAVGARVAKAGDTMTGPLTLSGAPTATSHAATKGYVDTEVGARVAKDGDTMTGFLTLHADPTAAMHAATKAYVDRRGPGGSTDLIATPSGTTYDVTGIPSWANVVEVLIVRITTAAVAHIRIRLGTASGFVNSGYRSASGSRGGEISDSTAFVTSPADTSPGVVSMIKIVRANDNVWVQNHVASEFNGYFSGGGGSVDIEDTLTQLRLFISSSNFTGGHFVVRWTA